MNFSTLKLMALFVFLTSSNISKASLISDISSETISEYVNVASFDWYSGYDIAFINQDLTIDVDVYFKGDTPSQTRKDIWEKGIEQIWNNAFDIFDGSFFYDVSINVDWVQSWELSHHSVEFFNTTGRASLTKWYKDDSGIVAAHEFGHMLGLLDEYPGGASKIIRPDSIMGQNLTNPHADHFDAFADWLSLKSGISTLSMIADTGDHHYDLSTPVPTPSTLSLFVIAFAFSIRQHQQRSRFKVNY